MMTVQGSVNLFPVFTAVGAMAGLVIPVGHLGVCLDAINASPDGLKMGK